MALLSLAFAESAGAFVYWTNGSSIGRATLEGAGVNKRFVRDIGFPDAIAVDRSHIYWTGQGENTIGRANLDGTGVDRTFISGDGKVRSVAVDADHIYWADPDRDTIGRANLDGTGVNQASSAAPRDRPVSPSTPTTSIRRTPTRRRSAAPISTAPPTSSFPS